MLSNTFIEVTITMTIHERLATLRSTLGLTTRAFGEAINFTGGAITNMEKGRSTIAERTIKDICREYRVNQKWFTTGEGPMFDDSLDSIVDSNEAKLLFESYSRLTNSDKMLVKLLVNSLAEKNL